MTRALDHLVIAYRDLEAAAERYRRLGFQVGARNRHPWGTENHIVQFDGAFLELVGLGEEFRAPAPDDPVYPFAGFLAEFLTRREGLAMLVLRSCDAEADRRLFKDKGLGERPRFDFARKGRRAGKEVDVAFSLAFARSDVFPDAGFFVCQQRFPENFWDAAAQVHPNGAAGVAELAFAHPRPEAAVDFLSAFLDAAPQAAPRGFQFALTGTRVTCATPETPSPAGLAAMRIAARDGSSFWVD
jgi:hypothetical protein